MRKGAQGPLLYSVWLTRSADVAQASSCATVDQGQATVPLNAGDQLRSSRGLTQFADANTTVLDAGQEVCTEGGTEDVRRAHDVLVQVVTVELKNRNSHVGKLLVAELVTADFDLSVAASDVGQGAA